MSAQVEPCRSCGRPVYWLTHFLKRWLMPVDVEPVLGGNVTVNLGAGTYALVKAHPDLRMHISHWTTCPEGDHRPEPL